MKDSLICGCVFVVYGYLFVDDNKMVFTSRFI